MRLMKVFDLDEIVGYLESQNVKTFKNYIQTLFFPMTTGMFVQKREKKKLLMIYLKWLIIFS